MRLENRIALITGGTSGIGLATATLFAVEGATVIVAGREEERLQNAAQVLGPKAETMKADVSQPEDILRLMGHAKRQHGRIDVLVVNAGMSRSPEFQQTDVAAYDTLMDLNCKGATLTVVHALPLLSDGASVIFTGSVASRKGQPGAAIYAGSKGYIRAFARTLGTDPELMRRRLRFNVVSPGPTETPLVHDASSNPEVRAYVEGMIPMGRWGRPEEVANAILFLASDQSSFTTGAEITVDGGMSHA